MLTVATFITFNEIIHWYQKFTCQCLFFSKIILVKVIYLLIRCYKTGFFLWNTYKTDRNGVNKQNRHTNQTLKERYHWNGLVSMKIRDTSHFLKQPHLFCQPLHFYGKKYLNAPPPLFFKNCNPLTVWEIFFFKNHTQTVVEKLFPDTFLKIQNWAYLWINSLKGYTVCFYCMPSSGLSKYIETKLQITCFYLL